VREARATEINKKYPPFINNNTFYHIQGYGARLKHGDPIPGGKKYLKKENKKFLSRLYEGLHRADFCCWFQHRIDTEHRSDGTLAVCGHGEESLRGAQQLTHLRW
jgi:hypothetical protein